MDEKRWVCVKNNVVKDIIECDFDYAEAFLRGRFDHIEFFTDPNKEPEIGWIYEDGKYTNPRLQ